MKKLLKRRTLILLAIVICLNGLLLYSLLKIPDGVIDKFSYRDIKDECEFFDPANTPSWCEDSHIADLDALCRTLGVNEDGQIQETEDVFNYYGIIAIVKVKDSQNVFVYSSSSEESVCSYTVLNPRKVYDFWKSTSSLWYSGVKTNAEVVDVIYQTKKTGFSSGDSIDIWERYFIIDQRLPKLVDRLGGDTYLVSNQNIGETWYPLEEGETYLVFGRYIVCGKDHEYRNGAVDAFYYGTYCLSDLTKSAGLEKKDELMQESLAYIQEHYPDVYNAYIAQAQ